MQSRLAIVFFLLIISNLEICAQKAEDVLAYIYKFKELAISEMKRTGVPAAIKLAQGIHETEAGKSNLVTRSNNHFGIKCKTAWAGDKVYHDDDARGECFRSYARPEDSYMDHSDFLKQSQRYAFLFDLDPSDYEAWAYGLKKAGYATNIRYSQLLIKLIKIYNLQDYTLIALGKIKEPDSVLALLSKTSSGEIFNEAAKPEIVTPSYPASQFLINNTKVIYVPTNTAWLSVAEKYGIPLTRLWDFNDLEKDDDLLKEAQLVYIQRKRKTGSAEFHTVQNGETLYGICQSEGIRLESLSELNRLTGDMEPAEGEKLNLQYASLRRPLLSGEKKTTSASILFKSNPMPNQKGAGISESLVYEKGVQTMHLVATKETLYSISKKYGVEPEKIKEWNGLDSLNLKTGQSLKIYRSN